MRRPNDCLGSLASREGSSSTSGRGIPMELARPCLLWDPDSHPTRMDNQEGMMPVVTASYGPDLKSNLLSPKNLFQTRMAHGTGDKKPQALVWPECWTGQCAQCLPCSLDVHAS